MNRRENGPGSRDVESKVKKVTERTTNDTTKKVEECLRKDFFLQGNRAILAPIRNS
jgi:hypothetical protein